MSWEIDDHIIDEIFDSCEFQLSDILPSDWAEKYRFMSSDVSAMEGMYSFDNSPYVREICDTLSPNHPARVIVIMKGAQLGLSTGFVENGIGWIISEQPGNILYLVGHDDLVEKAGLKVENMLDSTGIRQLIKSSANRIKNNKSGDKDRSKEFPGGNLTIGPTNHKTLRQVSYRYGFIDDFEAMKGGTKESGGTVPMIKQRFSTYAKTMKLCFQSTPEVRETSNIEPEYLKGDQRKYFVPCPCCGTYINFEWETENKNDPEKKAGIYWELNEHGELITESVGYVCQECGGFFTDQNKTEMLIAGEWRPTVSRPKDPDYVSYHISSLYGPTYMYGWEKYVKDYIEANPPDQPRNEQLHQTFVNLVLGQTYEPTAQELSSDSLKKNTRPYKIGVVPEKLSIADGNGRIIMLTIGADMNGTVRDEKWKHKEDDARLDWEIVAWSETGATYSVNHGSIGTFTPANIRNEAHHNHPDRVKWTYKRGSENCVWDEFDKLIATKIPTDTGRNMMAIAVGLDTAPYTTYSYPYVESNKLVIGVKGDKDERRGIMVDADYTPFRKSKDSQTANLWVLNVNRYKDILADYVGLIWDTARTPIQPSNFMNFPSPDELRYSDYAYFKHYEAEHKIIDEKTNKLIWQKKSQGEQNHMFDCRVYNLAARDIFVYKFYQSLKKKPGTWTDFVNLMTKG